MSDHDSDTDHHPVTSTTSSTPASTAARHAARAAKTAKRLAQEEELQTLRRMVTSLRAQHEVDRGVVESLEQQMVRAQVKEEQKHEPAAVSIVSASGNAGDQVSHVSHEHTDDSDEDDVDDDVGNVSHRSGNDGRISKAIKLPRIPKSLGTFSGQGGASNVRSWLQQFDTIRKALHWSDEESVAVAAVQFTDRAQQWYQDEGSKKSVSISWKTFKASLTKRFTPVINQLFIPKYTRNLSQRVNEKSIEFMDRVRVALRDLGVDEEEQVVRVFSSGLHDWITESLTLSVGDDHKISAKDLLDHCTRIELAKAIRHGTHFDAPHRAVAVGGDRMVPVHRAHPRYDRGYVPANRQGGMVTSNEKLQLNRNDSCKLCGQKGHWARECPMARADGANAGPRPARPLGGVNVAVNVGGGKVCSHCGKAGHLVDQCYTLKNEQRRQEAAHPARGGGGGAPPGRAAIRSIFQDDRVEHQAVRMIGMVQPHVAGVFTCQGFLGGASGVSLVCTLDTGADRVSCVSEETFRSLPPAVQKRGYHDESTGTNVEQALVSAGGHLLTVLGLCALPLRMKSNGGLKEMDVHLHIIRGLNVQCLLGSSFLLSCGNGINWQDRSSPFFELWTGDRVPLILRTTYDGKAGVGPGDDIKSIMSATEAIQCIQNVATYSNTDIAEDIEVVLPVPSEGVTLRHLATQIGPTRPYRQMPPISAAPGVVPYFGSSTPNVAHGDALRGVAPNDQRERMDMSIRLIQNVTIPAHSAMVVPYAKAYAGKLPVGSVLMTQGNEKLYGDGVMVARSTHQVSQAKDTKLVLQVTNTTSRPISYRRGQIVGTAEEVDIMALKETEEIEQSKDVHSKILQDIEEKIQAPSDDTALNTSHDKQAIMDVLSRFTHLFDDRYMGEARQSGEVVQHAISPSLPSVSSHGRDCEEGNRQATGSRSDQT